MSGSATRGIALIAIVTGCATTALQGQTRPTIVLTRGALEYPDAFTRISQLVELRDGRVLLLDSGEGALFAVDLARKRSSKVSRQGGGPLEYRAPGLLLGGGADTLLYYDLMQGRFLLLSASAVPLGTERFGNNDAEATLSGMTPSAMDARGRVYGITSGFSMGAAGGKNGSLFTLADTVEVQRLDRKSGRRVTVTRLRNAATQMKPRVEPSGGGMKLTVTAPDGQATDAWTVLGDGRVAVLRDGIYRVRFVTDAGRDVPGPVIPYQSVPITAAERKAIVDSVRTGMERSIAATRKAIGASGSASGKAPVQFGIVVLEPARWAANKPAYTGITASPDGVLWVSLAGRTGSRVQRFDVLNGSGALVAHVQLAEGESLAGWGRGTIYTIRTDEDDLQYLRRYSLPPLK
ncbi:MAG: hypothetical protein V4503_10430 [Gemmatimonadota bacterium]